MFPLLRPGRVVTCSFFFSATPFSPGGRVALSFLMAFYPLLVVDDDGFTSPTLDGRVFCSSFLVLPRVLEGLGFPRSLRSHSL